MIEKLVQNSLQEHLAAAQAFVGATGTADSIAAAAETIAAALRSGGKVLTCGNGGSLCDATHFAEELTGRFRRDRNPLPAIAINDPAHLTCVANDYSFGEVFSRYVDALGRSGDVLAAFSTSGNSENVVAAVRAAKAKGMMVIGFTRAGDNQLSRLSDVVIAVPHEGYSDRIQEMHITAVHIIIEAVEALL